MNTINVNPIIVNIPCPTKEESQKICQELLKQDLCGTAKISPIDLLYQDPKGGVGSDEVFLMSLKTTQSKLSDIHAYILKHHSWGTPCIEVLPMLTDMC